MMDLGKPKATLMLRATLAAYRRGFNTAADMTGFSHRLDYAEYDDGGFTLSVRLEDTGRPDEESASMAEDAAMGLLIALQGPFGVSRGGHYAYKPHPRREGELDFTYSFFIKED